MPQGMNPRFYYSVTGHTKNHPETNIKDQINRKITTINVPLHHIRENPNKLWAYSQRLFRTLS